MIHRPRVIAHAAIIAALYALLTYGQNLLLPGSASWMIQIRLSEMLCPLAFFTPAAAPGLAIGCLLFNLSSAGALPLDFLCGPLATFLAAYGMWRCRKFPLLGLFLPAVCNGLIIGWELNLYMGGGFLPNCLYVAAGEGIAMIPGAALYLAMKKRRLHRLLFMK